MADLLIRDFILLDESVAASAADDNSTIKGRAIFFKLTKKEFPVEFDLFD